MREIEDLVVVNGVEMNDEIEVLLVEVGLVGEVDPEIEDLLVRWLLKAPASDTFKAERVSQGRASDALERSRLASRGTVMSSAALRSGPQPR